MFQSCHKVVSVSLFISTAMISNVQAGEVERQERIDLDNHWVASPTLNAQSLASAQASFLLQMMNNIFTVPSQHQFEKSSSLTKQPTDLEPGWDLKPNKDGISLSFHY